MRCVWGEPSHIHAHKARRIHGRRFCHQAGHRIAGHLFVDVETHVGQLQTDVGIEMVGRDGIENLVVEFGAVARLLGIGNVFSQVVDADAHAQSIDDLGDAAGVGVSRYR